MKQFLTLAVCVLFFQQSYDGQSSEIVRKKVFIVYENETKAETVAMPASLERALTKLQKIRGSVKTFPADRNRNWDRPETVIRVAEYFEPETSDPKTGNKIFRYESHPASYPCIVGENAIYIFREGDTPASTEMFNLFLRESQLRVTTSDQALALIEFYFSATRGYFENRGKLILTKIEDIPYAGKKTYESETRRLKGVIKVPAVYAANGKYEVVLYTWEIRDGEVTKWDFIITHENQITVKHEIVGRL